MSVRSERLGIASSLSPRQYEALLQYAITGNQREAAHRMGIKWQTYKNHMRHARAALDVPSTIEALRVLGWLVVPG